MNVSGSTELSKFSASFFTSSSTQKSISTKNRNLLSFRSQRISITRLLSNEPHSLPLKWCPCLNGGLTVFLQSVSEIRTCPWLKKQDGLFGHIWPFLKQQAFFEAAGTLAKIGLSLKPNRQIKFSLSKTLIQKVQTRKWNVSLFCYFTFFIFVLNKIEM